MVRWNGSDRPTALVSSTRLTATIAAADVSVVGDFPVTVYDPAPAPGGAVTPPQMFRVVETILQVYLPVVQK